MSVKENKPKMKSTSNPSINSHQHLNNPSTRIQINLTLPHHFLLFRFKVTGTINQTTNDWMVVEFSKESLGFLVVTNLSDLKGECSGTILENRGKSDVSHDRTKASIDWLRKLTRVLCKSWLARIITSNTFVRSSPAGVPSVI